jgi:hypothetical protein
MRAIYWAEWKENRSKIKQDKKVTDKEREKKHLYAKLLSILTDEARLKYEKALANILTKKRGS